MREHFNFCYLITQILIFSSLNNVKGWLVESNKNYNSMIDKLETQANQLPVDQVKKRNSII